MPQTYSQKNVMTIRNSACSNDFIEKYVIYNLGDYNIDWIERGKTTWSNS